MSHDFSSQQRLARTAVPLFALSELAVMPSCFPFQVACWGLQNAASGADRWYIDGTGQCVQYPVDRENGRVALVLAVHERHRDPTTLLAQIQERDVDVLLAVCAQFLRRGVQDEATWFSAADFLDDRGLAPKRHVDRETGRINRAGHRREDLLEVAASLHRLSHLHLAIQLGGHGAKRRRRAEIVSSFAGNMPLFLFDDTYAPAVDAETVPATTAWMLRPGDWLAHYCLFPHQQVVRFPRQLLRYDPRKDLWEKRLARYLLFHERMNRKGQHTLTLRRSLQKLSEELSLPLDWRHPRRSRLRFEAALSRLQTDGFIAAWHYQDGREPEEHAGLKYWLQHSIDVVLMEKDVEQQGVPTKKQAEKGRFPVPETPSRGAETSSVVALAAVEVGKNVASLYKEHTSVRFSSGCAFPNIVKT